jgi:adenine-specific DNA-methyltransferase
MEKMITPFRKVKIEKKEYSFGRGGKGSVAGSSEVLLICTKE